MRRVLATCIIIVGGFLAGCEAYGELGKAAARATSPEYRAYEAQQKPLTTEQKAARDREARKQLCAQSGC